MNGEADWEEGRGRARSARMETGYIAMATKNKMTGSRQGATKEHADSEQAHENSCRSGGTRQIRGDTVAGTQLRGKRLVVWSKMK